LEFRGSNPYIVAMNSQLLAKNIFYRILNVLLLFGINMLLSRMAGTAGYGLLSLLVANAAIFNLLSAFGADSGITYNTASGMVKSGPIMSFTTVIILLQLLLLVFVEMICYSITGHYLLFKSFNTADWWIGLVFLASISIIEKYTALLYGKQAYTLANQLLFAGNLITICVFAIIYFKGNTTDPLLYIKAYILLSALQALILIIFTHGIAKVPLSWTKPDGSDIKNFFSYSMIAFVTNIIQFVAYRVDYWLLDYYHGEEQLGWYSLAVRLSQLFWVLPILLAGIILPSVAREQVEYENKKMLSLIRGMNMINLVAGVSMFFLAPFILPLLFGESFRNSVVLLQILLPGILLFCIATIFAAYFAGQKKLMINFYSAILCLLVILSLDMFLIPPMGMRGAAIASSIGYAVTAGYFIIMFLLNEKSSLSQVFLPGRSDWTVLKGIFRKGAGNE
jgi:O-antigen/teichoic acid export membrane protein